MNLRSEGELWLSQSMMQFEKSEADFQVMTYQALID